MIELVRIQRVKCFQDLSVPLGSLTVLTGANGGGKTTVIHSLLLAWLGARGRDIDLGRAFGQPLGEVSDMLNVGSDPSAGICIQIHMHGSPVLACEFDISNTRTQSLTARSQAGPTQVPAEFLETSLSFLCADRLGPQDIYNTAAIGDENPTGVRGEQVAQILAQEELRPVAPQLRHPDSSPRVTSSLLRQVEAWLSSIVRPIEVQATWFSNASAASLRFKQPGFLGEWIRPVNAGFGLTASIPIVVAALRIGAPGLLIVENPEAHLHPRGQSEMGRFLARVSASGTQTVIETHSDHVLNGIRRAVAVDRVIAASDVRVHFFDVPTEPDTLESRMRTLGIADNGEMESWPEHFFDQMEKDLGKLASVRRRRG
jgi:predicted ATPase